MKRKLAKKLWLGGAISGAVSGAGAGSVIPGWGTAAGAIVGFVGGGLMANKQKKAQDAALAEEEKFRNQTLLAQQENQKLQSDRFSNFKLMQDQQREKGYLAGLKHDSLMQEQQDSVNLMADQSYFKDYAGGRGKGFSNTGFYKLGGSMQLAQPDVLGVRQDPTRGGHIDNTASNAGIVKGRSHETGGVKLPGAELEGGESVVKSPYTGTTQVHSEELGVADHTNELIQRKGELEEKLSRIQDKISVIEFDLNTESTSIRRNSYKRQYDILKLEMEQYTQEIGEIDTQIEQLYQQQEGMKQGGQGTPMGQTLEQEAPLMRFGGKYPLGEPLKPLRPGQLDSGISDIGLATSNNVGYSGNTRGFSGGSNWDKVGKVAQFAAPFIDNLFNVHATNRLRNMQLPAPPVATPTLYGDRDEISLHADPKTLNPLLAKPTYLDPTHDVSDKLSAVERHTASASRGMMDNVSDSRIGRAMSAGVNLEGAHMKGQIHAEKLNQERVGRNVNRQIAHETQMTNVDRLNQYAMMNLERGDRVRMANVDLLNAYSRGNVDMINQYNLMNMDADYQHRLAQFDKDITTDITMPSQNMANFRDEVIGILDRNDMRSYQDKQLALQALLAENEGTFMRNIFPLLSKDEQKRFKEIFNKK